MGRIHHIPSQVHVDSDSWVPILQAREEEKDRRNDKSQGGEGDWWSVTLPQLYEIGHKRRLDISIILGSLPSNQNKRGEKFVFTLANEYNKKQTWQ